MHVKPKTPKTVVRDPRSHVPLPPEGKKVPESSYWVRRLASGCVVKTTAEDVAKARAKRLKAAATEAAKATAPVAEKTSDEPKGSKE